MDGVPTAIGVKAWSHQVIQNILTNEKYMGDALLGKTYVTDCISKKVRKNNGEAFKTGTGNSITPRCILPL